MEKSKQRRETPQEKVINTVQRVIKFVSSIDAKELDNYKSNDISDFMVGLRENTFRDVPDYIRKRWFNRIEGIIDDDGVGKKDKIISYLHGISDTMTGDEDIAQSGKLEQENSEKPVIISSSSLIYEALG